MGAVGSVLEEALADSEVIDDSSWENCTKYFDNGWSLLQGSYFSWGWLGEERIM